MPAAVEQEYLADQAQLLQLERVDLAAAEMEIGTRTLQMAQRIEAVAVVVRDANLLQLTTAETADLEL
jgi:hypothetical protein